MSENYTSKEKIEKALGITIDKDSTPNITTCDEFLDDADGMVNSEARALSNMTDAYGDLDTITKNLVLKMVRRLLHFRDPDTFPYEEVELTAEERRIIHKTHDTSRGRTWIP